MKRILESEWLDELPPNDPLAERSRLDLRRVNTWMGNLKIQERNLRNAFLKTSPKRIVEIGAGDGTLMLHLAQHFPHWQNVEITFVDRQNLVSEETRTSFQNLDWNVKVEIADVFEWLPNAPASDCI